MEIEVQLARLFGNTSKEAKLKTRSNSQWKKTLKKILKEIDSYITENINTDELHFLMLKSGLFAAGESLKDDEFWPGYTEGLTRTLLLLIGDYPDHRKNKGGRKQKSHYNLNRFRKVEYMQNNNQKLNTLIYSYRTGFIDIKDPMNALNEFRREFGFKDGYREFFNWYRKNFPEDYSKIF